MGTKQRVAFKREHYELETKESISPPLKELTPLREREITMGVPCANTKSGALHVQALGYEENQTEHPQICHLGLRTVCS